MPKSTVTTRMRNSSVSASAAETATPPSGVSPVEQTGQMTHREVLEALSGLLLAMFVAMLSSTVVSNALPRIVEYSYFDISA